MAISGETASRTTAAKSAPELAHRVLDLIGTNGVPAKRLRAQFNGVWPQVELVVASLIGQKRVSLALGWYRLRGPNHPLPVDHQAIAREVGAAIAEDQRRYRAANKERIQSYGLRYYQEHKDTRRDVYAKRRRRKES